MLDATGNVVQVLDKTATDHSIRTFVGFKHAFNEEVTFSTGAEPPVAGAGSKPVVRTVITFTGSRLCTVAIALPA